MYSMISSSNNDYRHHSSNNQNDKDKNANSNDKNAQQQQQGQQKPIHIQNILMEHLKSNNSNTVLNSRGINMGITATNSLSIHANLFNIQSQTNPYSTMSYADAPNLTCTIKYKFVLNSLKIEKIKKRKASITNSLNVTFFHMHDVVKCLFVFNSFLLFSFCLLNKKFEIY